MSRKTSKNPPEFSPYYHILWNLRRRAGLRWESFTVGNEHVLRDKVNLGYKFLASTYSDFPPRCCTSSKNVPGTWLPSWELVFSARARWPASRLGDHGKLPGQIESQVVCNSSRCSTHSSTLSVMQTFLCVDARMHAQKEVVSKCGATTETEDPEFLSIQ